MPHVAASPIGFLARWGQGATHTCAEDTSGSVPLSVDLPPGLPLLEIVAPKWSIQSRRFPNQCMTLPQIHWSLTICYLHGFLFFGFTLFPKGPRSYPGVSAVSPGCLMPGYQRWGGGKMVESESWPSGGASKATMLAPQQP